MADGCKSSIWGYLCRITCGNVLDLFLSSCSIVACISQVCVPHRNSGRRRQGILLQENLPCTVEPSRKRNQIVSAVDPVIRAMSIMEYGVSTAHPRLEIRVARRRSGGEGSRRDVRGGVFDRGYTMRDRIPQSPASWCLKDTYEPGGVQTEPHINLTSCLLAQQPANSLRDTPDGLPHHQGEQPRKARLDGDGIAKSLSREPSENSGSTVFDAGVDVCNSSSTDNIHTSAASVSGETVRPSFAEPLSFGAARPSSSSATYGPPVASLRSAAAHTHVRSVLEMCPTLSSVTPPLPTPSQEITERRPELEAGAVEAVSHAARREICESKVTLVTDTVTAGSTSVLAVFDRGQNTVAGPSAEKLPTPALDSTAGEPSFENQREPSLFEKKCVEERKGSETILDVHASILNTCSSPGHQQLSLDDSPSPAARRSQLVVVSECIQRQQFSRASSKKQPWEEAQMLQQEIAKPDEASGQRHHQQFQESSMRAKGCAGQRTYGKSQEKEILPIHSSVRNLQPLHPSQPGGLVASQTRDTFMRDWLDHEPPHGTGEARSKYSRHSARTLRPPLSNLLALHPACVHPLTAQQRNGSCADEVDTKGVGGEKWPERRRTHTVPVGADTAAFSLLHSVATEETLTLAADNVGLAGSSDVCTAEEKNVRTGADAVQNTTTRETRDPEVSKGQDCFVTYGVETVTRAQNGGAECQRHKHSERNVHGSGIDETSGEGGCEASVVSRKVVASSRRHSVCSSRSSNGAEIVAGPAYCAKWVRESWSVAHHNEKMTEGTSTFSSSGGRDEEEESKTCSSGVGSFSFGSGNEGSSFEEAQTGLGYNSRRNVGPCASGRFRTPFNGDDFQATVDAKSNGEEESAGNGRPMEKQWRWCFWRVDDSCVDSDKNRCTCCPFVPLKIVMLLSRCSAAVRSRFTHQKSGRWCAGAADSVTTVREEASLEHPGQDLGYPQLPQDATQQKRSEQQGRRKWLADIDTRDRPHDLSANSEEKWKTHTNDNIRALFECCVPPVPSSPSTPLGLSKYVLLCVYTLQAFLTGCVYFGWPALSSMLYRSGAYAWLCSPSDVAGAAKDSGYSAAAAAAGSSTAATPASSRLYLCNSQDAAVAPLFTVCHVSDCIMCVIAGYLTDRCSPKGVCMFGQSLHAVGWTLLACSSKGFPAYVPAMIFIGCGSATANLPLLRVALLFPRNKATVITILGAANTGSFAVPCILDGIWRRAGVRTNAATTGAARLTGASPVLPGDGTGDIGPTAGITDGTALLQGGEGGGGWTFTDICLLYLGVGPLCCMLLAAFFLPARRFASPAESQKTGQRKREKIEKTKQKERRHRCMVASGAAAAPSPTLNTDTNTDFVKSAMEVDVEQERRSTSNQGHLWKLWSMCSQHGNLKQPPNSERQLGQQQQRPAEKTLRLLFPFHRHRQHEDRDEQRQHDCQRGEQRTERCMQHQRQGSAGEGLRQCVQEAVTQRVATGKTTYGSVELSLSGPDDKDMRLQRTEKSHRNNICVGDTLEDDLQPPLEDTGEGIDWNGPVYNIGFSTIKRAGCGMEEHARSRRKAYARPAVGEEKRNTLGPAQIETSASGMCFWSNENSEQGDGITSREASRRSSEVGPDIPRQVPSRVFREAEATRETYILRDFLCSKEAGRDAVADKDAETVQTEGGWANGEIPFESSLATFSSLQLPATCSPCLQQEDLTSIACEAAQIKVRIAEAAAVDRKWMGGEFGRALCSAGKNCKSSAPGEKEDADRQHGRRRAEKTSLEKKQLGTVCGGTESEGGQPKENTTEIREGQDRRRLFRLLCGRFPLCDLCGSLAIRRRVTLQAEEVGGKDDSESKEELRKRTRGRSCRALSSGSIDEPREGGANHALQPVPLHADASGPSVVLCTNGQTTEHDSTSQTGRASSSTACRKASESASVPTALAADVFPSSKIHAADKHFVPHEPWMRRLPDTGEGMPTTAKKLLRVTVKAEKPEAVDFEAARPASNAARASAVGYNADSQKTTTAMQDSTAGAAGISTVGSAGRDAEMRQSSDCSADCTTNKAVRAAPRASVSALTLGKSLSSSDELTGARRGLTCADPPGCSGGRPPFPCVGSGKRNATFFSQCLSVHFACLVFYSGMVSVAMSFMQSSSSRLFSAKVLEFMEWALPFSFVPCVFMGKMIDMFGPFPVLLFMNTMGLLSYLCAASTAVEGVHYISVLAFCIYVSLDSEQIYCYVEYTFRPEHFGRLSGLLLAIDGTMSLVSIPLYDHLTVRNLGGNPLPVAFGISGLLASAYLLLTGLWLHRRRYPDPFGLLDGVSDEGGTAYRKGGGSKEGKEEDVERRTSKLRSEIGELVSVRIQQLPADSESTHPL